MERKIISGTYRDYLFLFGDSRTAYSDLSAKKSAVEKNLYIMLEDDLPAGYICANMSENLCNVTYAYTVAEKRRHGVFTALLKYLTQLDDIDAVLVQISASQENFASIVKTCEAAGFHQDSVVKIFRADWESLHTWKETYFDNFMATHGHKYLEYFARRNFKVYSFADAPEKYLEQLYHSHENFFENTLDVKRFFDGYDKNLVARDISFLSVKDDKLAAYYLATSPDGNNVVVEQTAVAKKYLNSGAMLPLWDKFIRTLYIRQCNNMAFAIYSDNTPAIKFDAKITKNLKLTETRLYKYAFTKNFSQHEKF